MGSKTISLENSAYSKLRAQKRPGESFSDVVHRILKKEKPSLLELKGFMSKRDAKRLGETIDRMRAEDIGLQGHSVKNEG